MATKNRKKVLKSLRANDLSYYSFLYLNYEINSSSELKVVSLKNTPSDLLLPVIRKIMSKHHPEISPFNVEIKVVESGLAFERMCWDMNCNILAIAHFKYYTWWRLEPFLDVWHNA